MTPTPERSAPSSEMDATAWADRSAFGSMRGIPWWGAVLLAVLLTVAGSVIDLVTQSQPGIVFVACYVVGCLLAVGLVRRSRLFVPMVQPPLLLAAVLPIVVLTVGTGIPDGASATAVALAIARAIIPSFPVMAVTTLAVVGVGVVRVYALERKDKPEREGDAPPDARTRKAPRPRNDSPQADESRKRPADGTSSGQPRGRGSAPRPAKGAGPEQRPDRGKRGEEPARPGPGRGRQAAPKAGAGEQGARQPQRDAAAAKQGGRGPGQRGSGPPGNGRQPGPQGGQQGAQPPGRGRGAGRPAPGRGSGPRQAPPGRGNPPPRQSGGEQPRRPRPPRRDS